MYIWKFFWFIVFKLFSKFLSVRCFFRFNIFSRIGRFMLVVIFIFWFLVIKEVVVLYGVFLKILIKKSILFFFGMFLSVWWYFFCSVWMFFFLKNGIVSRLFFLLNIIFEDFFNVMGKFLWLLIIIEIIFIVFFLFCIFIYNVRIVLIKLC